MFMIGGGCLWWLLGVFMDWSEERIERASEREKPSLN
jgi:hypothetical protein